MNGTPVATPPGYPASTPTSRRSPSPTATATAGHGQGRRRAGRPGQRHGPEGDPFTAVLVTTVSHGTLSLGANGGFTYTPTTGYTGPDSFTYRANDGTSNSNTVTVPSPSGVAIRHVQLNGSSQYITFGTAPGLDAATYTIELWFKRTAAGVGTSTGTGGIASAIPLLTKGRAEAETPANLNMDWFLGIDATSGQLVADFEDSANGANHPVTGNAVVTATSGTTSRRPTARGPGTCISTAPSTRPSPSAWPPTLRLTC